MWRFAQRQLPLEMAPDVSVVAAVPGISAQVVASSSRVVIDAWKLLALPVELEMTKK